MAQSQLLGADALVSLDRQRADLAAVELSAVPVLASTTAAGLARRFGPEHLVGVETAIADLVERSVDLLPLQRRIGLGASVTVDLDSTDVEVYGSKKQGVAYNYQGQRAGRPHLATWAEVGLTVAADLLAGNDDVRPRAADMLRRALAGIPEPVRARAAAADRLRTRVDAGYFTAELANAAVGEGCDFAIAAKRNTAMWRAYASIEPDAWVDAIGMPGAQVAAVDYAPAGWPVDTYTIVRRVRVEAETISADPRSRRRRTIDKDQLALALEGTATHAYAVSFIVTNIPANDRPGDTSGNAEIDPRGRSVVPTSHRDRGPHPRGQARRRTPQAPLGRSEREHRVDVGSAPGREPLGPPSSTHQDRPARSRTRRPTAPRTALRPSPVGPSRTPADAATATRRPPAPRRAHPDPRTRHRGLTPPPRTHDQEPGEPSPGTTPGTPTHPSTPTTRPLPRSANRGHDSCATRGSGSEREHRVDVGRAAGREPLDPAPSTHQDRPARPRARRPTAPRTTLRPRPVGPSRTPADAAAATRRPPAPRRAHPDPRTRLRGLTPPSHPDHRGPGEPSPATTAGTPTCPTTPTPHPQHGSTDRGQDPRATRGSGSDQVRFRR